MVYVIILVLLLIFALVAWYFKLPQSPRATQFQGIVLAHRGWHKNVPENSLRALEEAAKRGVSGVELDVRATRDGVLVIMHDSTIDRTTNGKGKVSLMPYEELKKYTLADGSSIPTLDEVLTLAKKLGIKVELEVKYGIDTIIHEDIDAVVQGLKQAFEKHQAYDYAFAAVWMPRIAYMLRKADPRIVTAHVMPARDQGWLYYLSRLIMPFVVWFCGMGGIEPHDEYSTPAFIEAWKKRVQFINVWTVNPLEDQEKYKKLGVTYQTNCPFGDCQDMPDETITP